MSKAALTLDDIEDVVPPALRRKWEKLYVQTKEKLTKLEALLRATGGLPPLDGSPAPEPRVAVVKTATKGAQRQRAPSRKKRGRRRSKASTRRAPKPTIAPEAPAQTTADATSDRPARTAAGTSKRRYKTGTWAACIRDIVTPTTHAWTYTALKTALMDTPVADLLRRSDKAFYGALPKLEADKLIVRYKGHVFSPEGYAKFEDDFTAGRVRDLASPNVAHHSPMGDAIVAMMRDRSVGAESGHIIWHLRRDPEFAEALKKNPTHIYNVLKRLIEKNLLRKSGKRYYYVAIKDETPPDGESGSASNSSGESGVSPSDSPSAPHSATG